MPAGCVHWCHLPLPVWVNVSKLSDGQLYYGTQYFALHHAQQEAAEMVAPQKVLYRLRVKPRSRVATQPFLIPWR